VGPIRSRLCEEGRPASVDVKSVGTAAVLIADQEVPDCIGCLGTLCERK